MIREVTNNQIRVATNFLFPNLETKSNAYEEIYNFIHDEFESLQTSVLYFRNNSFLEILKRHGLDVGTKEVIITSKSVLASEHYHLQPRIIYDC